MVLLAPFSGSSKNLRSGFRSFLGSVFIVSKTLFIPCSTSSVIKSPNSSSSSSEEEVGDSSYSSDGGDVGVRFGFGVGSGVGSDGSAAKKAAFSAASLALLAADFFLAMIGLGLFWVSQVSVYEKKISNV